MQTKPFRANDSFGVSEWERKGLTRVVVIMPYTPSRLHVKGAILGYRRWAVGCRVDSRSKVAQYSNQSLIKIEGVNTTKDAEFYFGKRVAYVYKVGNASNLVTV